MQLGATSTGLLLTEQQPFFSFLSEKRKTSCAESSRLDVTAYQLCLEAIILLFAVTTLLIPLILSTPQRFVFIGVENIFANCVIVTALVTWIRHRVQR